MSRQIIQSCYQFAVVLVAQLLAMSAPPTDIAQLWTPVLYSLAAALAIWGGSAVHTAIAPDTTNAKPPQGPSNSLPGVG